MTLFSIKKYRNAEYTAAACKFLGVKSFLGCRGKHLFGRGQSILGFNILFNIGFNIRFNIESKYCRGGTHPQCNPSNGHTYFHKGGTHPQCNPTNGHSYFHKGGGRTHNLPHERTHIFSQGGGTHPQCNQTNGHTYFHRGGGKISNSSPLRQLLLEQLLQ